MNNKLNELMAEKVMGWHESMATYWRCVPNTGGMDEMVVLKSEWNPTKDIAQAMRCAVKAKQHVEISIYKNGVVECEIVNTSIKYQGSDVGKLPLYVCEAISEAIGGE